MESEEWEKPKNPVKAVRGNRQMDVDAAMKVTRGDFAALWQEDEEEEEIQCHECNMGFHRR